MICVVRLLVAQIIAFAYDPAGHEFRCVVRLLVAEIVLCYLFIRSSSP